MDKFYYEMKFPLTAGMQDENDILKPHAILDILQEIATVHAKQMKASNEYFPKPTYGWIIARQTVEYFNVPKGLDYVIVKTFPHKANRLEYIREYEICDEQGNTYVRCASLWLVFDFATKRMVKDNMYPEGEFIESVWFKDRKIEKPQDVSSYDITDTYRVRKSDLDLNKHMNNARYVIPMFDNLPFNYENIHSFTINYIRQAKENDIMNLHTLVEDNKFYLTGTIDNLQYFTTSVTKK